MTPQPPPKQPNPFRGTWTYAPDAVHTPRSIFRVKPAPESAPAAPAPASAANTTTASPQPTAPPERTPERYMSEAEFAESRTAILDALAPFPDAHMAVVTALRRAAGIPD